MQVGRAERRVVGVNGWKVREDTRPVDSFPPQCVMRERVRLIPRQLLREHPFHTHVPCDGRQCCRVSEGVRQPHVFGHDAEFALEESLAFQELSNHCLPADHVRVGFDPLASDDYPPAFGNALTQALEHVRGLVTQPLILLG